MHTCNYVMQAPVENQSRIKIQTLKFSIGYITLLQLLLLKHI